MKLSKLLKLDDLKSSKRREALKKILRKLEKKAEKLEAEMATNKSDKKLKTKAQHQQAPPPEGQESCLPNWNNVLSDPE